MARRPRRWGYDSRGTPAVVHLPGCLAIALLCFLPLLAPDLIERCIGYAPDPPDRKGAAAVLSALATLCSPLLFLGPTRNIVIGVTIVALIIASLWARHWMKEHQAHWDVIRAEERARRAEKRRLKAARKVEPPAKE
ncbi:hypothetical protein [Sandarakinorhabdus rubra]|uniref:hypothetical protein n=1 Tax=Sandarakinorhabdus rubra TaxID=2672568 RepID=UPI0013DAA121|nr:hypothetical protein [Sandarakinorhabdus rubra]